MHNSFYNISIDLKKNTLSSVYDRFKTSDVDRCPIYRLVWQCDVFALWPSLYGVGQIGHFWRESSDLDRWKLMAVTNSMVNDSMFCKNVRFRNVVVTFFLLKVSCFYENIFTSLFYVENLFFSNEISIISITIQTNMPNLYWNWWHWRILENSLLGILICSIEENLQKTNQVLISFCKRTKLLRYYTLRNFSYHQQKVDNHMIIPDQYHKKVDWIARAHNETPVVLLRELYID